MTTVPGPEILDSHAGGGALPPPPPPPASSGRGRRRAWIIGGGVGGAVLIGVGAWAVWTQFFATGPQPAEALPASTVGYVSVDLDPSGKQKLAALHTLEKFPEFADNVDIDSQDDLRQKLFDAAQDAGACPSLDFGDDIDPWLGDRFAVAAVDLGDDLPAAVGVLQVKNADRAEKGLDAVRDCVVDDGGPDFGWSLSDDGDWVVLAETQDIADQVTEEAADDPLSEDDDFKHWTEAAGDPGILTAYAAPGAGRFLADAVDQLPLGFGDSYSCEAYGSGTADPDGTVTDEDESFSCDDVDDLAGSIDDDLDEVRDRLRDMVSDFGGAALTVRFHDEALEVQTAVDSDFGGVTPPGVGTNSDGDAVVADLPEDTAAVFGVGFESGWADAALDQIRRYVGDEQVDDVLAEAEQETGLDLPGDIEKLLGSSAAVSLGAGFDPDTTDDPSDLPVAVTIQGDPDDVESVLDTLRSSADLPSEAEGILDSDSEGDRVVVGPSADYRQQVLGMDGDGLGGSAAFRDVVPEARRAGALLFVDFNAFDDQIASIGEDDLTENYDPLAALGVSSWLDDGISHTLLKLTTD